MHSRLQVMKSKQNKMFKNNIKNLWNSILHKWILYEFKRYFDVLYNIFQYCRWKKDGRGRKTLLGILFFKSVSKTYRDILRLLLHLDLTSGSVWEEVGTDECVLRYRIWSIRATDFHLTILCTAFASMPHDPPILTTDREGSAFPRH